MSHGRSQSDDIKTLSFQLQERTVVAKVTDVVNLLLTILNWLEGIETVRSYRLRHSVDALRLRSEDGHGGPPLQP